MVIKYDDSVKSQKNDVYECFITRNLMNAISYEIIKNGE
jgi:hypothetical protein